MLEGLKEAMQYLVKKGEDNQIFKEIDGQTYTNLSLSMIQVPKPGALVTTTLTSLVDYIKSGYDEKASANLIVHVKSPNEVILYSELRKDKIRETYLNCQALIPSVHFGRYLDIEDFNIMLQSNFVRTDETADVLRIVGNVKETVEVNSVDDGVSQTAVVKTGVASVGKAILPEQVELAPYRTFPEIQQPTSTFILRLQKGPAAALFEADGGAWRNKAMESIKVYLTEQLGDISNIKIMS